MGALEDNLPGFEHIAVIAAFQCLGDPLLDQDQRDAILAVQRPPISE